ncbi:serine hydrolase domain-containing protein [Candidatus Latescibacterota bacterium]
MSFSRRLSLLSIMFMLISITFAVQHANGQEFPTASPEEVGLSSERLGKIDQAVNGMIENDLFAGAVTMIIRRNKLVHFKTFGMMDRENNKPMRKDAIFRIASMTKPITCLAAMILYEEGHFLLSDPVSMYIPEFADPLVLTSESTTVPAKKEITIRNLMNHTSGLSSGASYHAEIYKNAGIQGELSRPESTIGDMVRVLAGLPLLHHPGEDFTYGLSHHALGYLIEVVSGMTLDAFIRERILIPLDMKDTYFYLPESKLSRLAGLYKPVPGGGIERVPFRETETLPFGTRTYYSGGSGLYSSITDYARFCMMIMNGGELDGVRMISRKSVELMTTNSIGDSYSAFRTNSGDKYGLGFGIRSERGEYDELESIGTVMWDGAWHTRFWIDPKEEMIGLFMSQLSPKDWRLPAIIRNTAYQAIID